MKTTLFRTSVVGMKSILALIAASGLLAALAGSARANTLVYIVNGSGLNGSGEFGTVDLTTGAFQQIGPIEPDGYFGLAPGPNGSLMSLTYAGNLDSINPATGVPTRIGPTGLERCVIPTDPCGPTSAFSLGAFAGKIYATDFKNDLYVVNPLTGAAMSLSLNTGLPANPFVLGSQNSDGTLNFADEAIWESGGNLYVTYDALTFNPATGMPAAVVIAPQLYQIDPATGHATVIGPTDLGIGGGISVNGTSYVFNDASGQIATIDLSTGTTSPIGSFDPSAGVIQGATAVVTIMITGPGVVSTPNMFQTTSPFVSLSAAESTSFNPGPLSYSWTLSPGYPSAAILHGNAATPQIQLQFRGTYQFTLTVTDATGATATTTVTVQYI